MENIEIKIAQRNDFQQIAAIYNEYISLGTATMQETLHDAEMIQSWVDNFNEREKLYVLKKDKIVNILPHIKASKPSGPYSGRGADDEETCLMKRTQLSKMVIQMARRNSTSLKSPLAKPVVFSGAQRTLLSASVKNKTIKTSAQIPEDRPATP